MNSFIPQTFRMNQIVFKEGAAQENIYIVVEGDFNLVKTYKKKKFSICEDDQTRSFLGPAKFSQMLIQGC